MVSNPTDKGHITEAPPIAKRLHPLAPPPLCRPEPQSMFTIDAAGPCRAAPAPIATIRDRIQIIGSRQADHAECAVIRTCELGREIPGACAMAGLMQ